MGLAGRTTMTRPPPTAGKSRERKRLGCAGRRPNGVSSAASHLRPNWEKAGTKVHKEAETREGKSNENRRPRGKAWLVLGRECTAAVSEVSEMPAPAVSSGCRRQRPVIVAPCRRAEALAAACCPALLRAVVPLKPAVGIGIPSSLYLHRNSTAIALSARNLRDGFEHAQLKLSVMYTRSPTQWLNMMQERGYVAVYQARLPRLRFKACPFPANICTVLGHTRALAANSLLQALQFLNKKKSLSL